MADPLDHPLVKAILKAFPGATVTEITQTEIDAIIAASDKAGEHLDKIDKTDLAKMTRDECLRFIEVVVMAYADEMTKLHKPYAVLRSGDDPIIDDEVPF